MITVCPLGDMYNGADFTSLEALLMSEQQSPSPRPETVRRTIAALAARLIAEEGIHDYGFAKRKAARQLGATDRELPTNAEIEEALQAWRSLYRDEEDDLRLHEMREAAVEVMRFLAPFRPYVSGGVLEGTAGAFSEIELETYADSAKDIEIFLLGQGLRYEHREVRRRDYDAPEAVMAFDWGEVPVRLSIFNLKAERSPRRGPSGHARERMRLETFERFIQAHCETS